MANAGKDTGPAGQTGTCGCLVRVGWMLIGNALLLLSAFSIAIGGGALSWVDGAFWAVVAAVIGIRYLDIAKMGGATAAGQPATMSHWRRYVLLLVVFSLAAWCIAHLVAWCGR